MKGYDAVDRYIQETNMLDYSDIRIQKLIQNRGWLELSDFDRIKAIYNYVRDEILFGYNIDDSIPASKVLADGYGQCNTKGTLFMALLRACNIPCRVHGFTIDKKLQKGAMTGLVYRSAPILHPVFESQTHQKTVEVAVEKKVPYEKCEKCDCTAYQKAKEKCDNRKSQLEKKYKNMTVGYESVLFLPAWYSVTTTLFTAILPPVFLNDCITFFGALGKGMGNLSLWKLLQAQLLKFTLENGLKMLFR